MPLVRHTGERTHHRSANARNATRQRPDVRATETGYAALLSKCIPRAPSHPERARRGTACIRAAERPPVESKVLHFIRSTNSSSTYTAGYRSNARQFLWVVHHMRDLFKISSNFFFRVVLYDIGLEKQRDMRVAYRNPLFFTPPSPRDVIRIRRIVCYLGTAL